MAHHQLGRACCSRWLPLLFVRLSRSATIGRERDDHVVEDAERLGIRVVVQTVHHLRELLRPEHLRLAADGDTVVELVEFYGHDTVYELRLPAGDRIRARASGAPAFRRDEKVSISYDGPPVRAWPVAGAWLGMGLATAPAFAAVAWIGLHARRELLAPQQPGDRRFAARVVAMLSLLALLAMAFTSLPMLLLQPCE